MIMNQIVIFIILVSVVTETCCDSPPAEDIVDEYYTVASTKVDQITEQDRKYAQTVLDTDKDPKVMMSIFAYQDKIRRHAISQAITELNQKIVDGMSGRHARRRRRRYWISESHTPQIDLVLDICFSMIFDESLVLAQYLYNFFETNNYTMITTAMVLTKDIMNMITQYDLYNYSTFKDDRKKQGKSYEHMLRVWVERNRESMDNQNITPEAIKLNLEALNKEYDDGFWKENRDQLELIVIKKNIKFARLVMQEFENAHGGKHIEDMIKESGEKHGLNKDLAYAYASLAGYIKNKYTFVANLLGNYSDEKSGSAVWMMCIAVIHPQEWPKIDEIFKKEQKGDSLSRFITTRKLIKDEVVAEAMALLVDSKFKPTLFKKREPNDNSGKVTPPPP